MGLPPSITPEIIKILADIAEPGAPDPGASVPKQKAQETISGMYWLLRDMGCPRIVAWVLAGFVGGLVGFGTVVLAGLTWAIVHLVGPIAVAILEIMTQLRRESVPALNDLTTATVNELLGTDFKPTDLPLGPGGGEALKRAQVMGDRIITTLEKEFIPAGKLGPEQGQVAAKAFTGFVANFSVASAFISVLGEFVSLGQIEAFRELGVELAENLGLGRMARRGLSELVSVAVSDQYEHYLNKKYRPKLLGPSEAIRAWLARRLSADELREELALQGYSEEKINALIENQTRELSIPQLKILLAGGQLSQEDFELYMGRLGWTPELVKLWQQAEALYESRQTALSVARNVLNDVVNGIVSQEEFRALLNLQPFTQQEIERFILQAIELSRLPRRTLTLAQMRQAFIDGIVDVAEWQDYLIRQGYGRDDRTVLTLQLLLDAKQQAEADALRKQREAERQARRQQPPP